MIASARKRTIASRLHQPPGRQTCQPQAANQSPAEPSPAQGQQPDFKGLLARNRGYLPRLLPVIAIFFTDHVALGPLAAALIPIALYAFAVQRGVRQWWILMPPAIVAWALVHASGVHATVAGVVLGFTVPVLGRHASAKHFEHLVRPLSAGFAVPVFAFFAAGAYSLGIMTSPGSPFDLSMNFWLVLPLGVLIAASFGVLLGLPVLPLRGDYLAIVTLGFGEIIRLFLVNREDVTAGSQGLSAIARPEIGSFRIETFTHWFYFILVAAVIVGFIASRLRDSRIGRAWEAIREDEDVAAAMGVNKVKYKPMAKLRPA